MTAVQIINATLQIWGSLTSILIAICLYYAGRFRLPSGRIYRVMLLLNTGAMLMDVCALFLRGHSGMLVWGLLWFTNTASFSCNTLMIPVFVHYLLVFLRDHGAQVEFTPLFLSFAISGAMFLGLIANLFYPFIFGIDQENFYYRGPYFALINLVGLAGLLVALYLIAKYRRSLSPSELLLVSSYVLIPLVAIPLQSIIYGIAMINIGNTLSLTMIYLVLQVNQARRIAEQENLLVQSRYTTALSQIQPHFLFNALNTIQYLCRTDPPKAIQTIGCFSSYLRVNMESLSCTKPVPLREDINHLLNYIAIERLRFPDIEFVFDLQTTDFDVPALTLQPLVENAIKHGVRQLSKGGEIKVSSWEDARSYILEIQDNGGGFSKSPLDRDDGRTHVGIPNTRTRIELMCHGQMRVDNCPGQGVTVHIEIPRIRM